MKKNGFTLTEILAVVIILSLLMLIIAPNLLNNIKNKQNKITEAQKQMIEEAANLYAESYFSEDDNVCITVGDLIDYGFLNNDVQDVDSTKNENEFKNQTIMITAGPPRTITIEECDPD